MKNLESGKDKLQKICDALRKETLDPARQEAREVIENAHMQAAEIVEDAKEKAERILQEANREIEEKKRVAHASLSQSCRQSVEALKQRIEKELFQQDLTKIIAKEMSEPKLVAEIVTALVQAMEKGTDEEFTAFIPEGVSPRSINEKLAAHVLARLAHKTVVAGDFAGGVKLQLQGKKITVDVSDAAVQEMIGQYIRRDLRDLVFGA